MSSTHHPPPSVTTIAELAIEIPHRSCTTIKYLEGWTGMMDCSVPTALVVLTTTTTTTTITTMRQLPCWKMTTNDGMLELQNSDHRPRHGSCKYLPPPTRQKKEDRVSGWQICCFIKIFISTSSKWLMRRKISPRPRKTAPFFFLSMFFFVVEHPEESSPSKHGKFFDNGF